MKSFKELSSEYGELYSSVGASNFFNSSLKTCLSPKLSFTVYAFSSKSISLKIVGWHFLAFIFELVSSLQSSFTFDFFVSKTLR